MAKVPARLIEGIAVRLGGDGIQTAVHLDVESLIPISAELDPQTIWVPVSGYGEGQLRRVNFNALDVMGVAWDDVVDKPDTFPPTVPIAIGDVTGLQDALDAIEAVEDGQTAQLAALQTSLDDLDDRVTALEDTTPDAFVFIDVTDAVLSTVYTSNDITVSGIGVYASISITGGEYRINGGVWTSVAGTVGNGDSVRVRGTSSVSYSTAVDVVLTIGGVSDTYSITTEALSVDIDFMAARQMLTLTTDPRQYMVADQFINTQA